MRVLFTSTPGAGHLLPLLPVARVAQRAGHEVIVATGGSVAGYLVAAGLRHADVGAVDIDTLRREFPEIEAMGRQERPRAVFKLVFAGRAAADLVSGVLDLADGWRPELIVHEDADLGSWIAAEKLGVPHATIQATAGRAWIRSVVAEPLGELRALHGLPPDPDLAGLYGEIFFTTRPRSLRDPDVELPPGYAELRPEADDDPSGGPVPDWLMRPARGPRVAVTMGTVNSHRTDVLRPIIDGLGGIDVEVVVALGAHPATLGDVPPNVRVERYVPMSLLLPRSNAIVHHGGSGTTLAAAAAGLPMVVVPLTADQPVNAEACRRAGMAVVLETDGLTSERAVRSVRDILDDPAYRQRAAAIAAEIAGMPSPDAVWKRLEALA